MEDFIKTLKNTKFEAIDFDDLLIGYFGKELISKQKKRNNYAEKKRLFFQMIINQFQGNRAEKWLLYIFTSKKNAYRIINSRYDGDKEELNKDLTNVCKAYNYLTFDNKNSIRLAILSSIITKNPHSFDDNTPCGNLLVNALSFHLNSEYPQNAESLMEILYILSGIIKDEVSNYTLCSGLL